MADRYTLSIDGGATYQLTVSWVDASGNAIDLTGYSARLAIRRPSASTNTLLLTESAGIAITAADGRLDITIAPSQTTTLIGVYNYTLEVESPGGVITRLLQGQAIATEDLTP